MSKVRVPVSRVRVRAVERPHRPWPVAIAAVALGAVLVLGAGVAQAQEAEAPADSIDGTWAVDGSIGSFDDFSNSWVGFRVAEVLNPGGEVDAVGRTPAVSGELVASGSTIESAVIEADLTAIVSDRPRRDGAIQRSLETGTFPTATFVSSGPVDLGAVPAEGEPFTVAVPGVITIRDVSQEVEFELTGQRVGDVVVVIGTLPVDFTAFGVTMPTAPIVVSVEDSGDLEWQLFFARQAEDGMAEDEMSEDGMADADAGDDEPADDEMADGAEEAEAAE